MQKKSMQKKSMQKKVKVKLNCFNFVFFYI
jgi:hypothetical protein